MHVNLLQKTQHFCSLGDSSNSKCFGLLDFAVRLLNFGIALWSVLNHDVNHLEVFTVGMLPRSWVKACACQFFARTQVFNSLNPR